jgi:hypothetical protein
VAPIVIKDEIAITKVRAAIWSLLTDISRWSRWNRLIKRAAVYGPVKPGTEFKFLSGKWDFDGIINEAIPNSIFVIKCNSIGLRLRISWEILEQINGAKVAVNVAVSGWIVSLFKHKVRQTLTDDLFTLLYSLKTTLERGEKSELSHEHGISKQRKKRHISGPLGFLFRQNKDGE